MNAAAKASSVCDDSQPYRGASMIAYTSAPTPKMDSSAPGMSSLGRSARAGAGACLVAEGLDSLDFSGAGVTLLTRAA